MALLDSGVDGLPRQAELVKLLRCSKITSELLAKLEKITDPMPSLALEMCRAFRRQGRNHAGMRLLRESHLPTPVDDESRRLIVEIQGEIALCESDYDDIKACGLFADAIRSSIDLLGSADKVTVQLRVNCALFLESSFRYSGALDVLSALKAESGDSLHPWKEYLTQTEERLRYKRIKKRRYEKPMPGERSLVEEDEENTHRSEPHGPSKKRKLAQEPNTEAGAVTTEDSKDIIAISLEIP